MRHLRLFFAALAFAVCAGMADAAETLYARFGAVPVKAAARPGAAIIETAPKGAAFVALDADGAYVSVRTASGKTGYVLSRYLTAEKPVVVAAAREKKGGVFGTLFRFVFGRGRKGNVSRAASPPSMPPEIRALDNDVARIAPRQVDEFLREGRLGEHWDGVYR